MPRQSLLDALYRWQAMDKQLLAGRFDLPAFAKEWNVSVKTVRRDLVVFKERGQRIEHYRDKDQFFYYRYLPDVRPLFTSSLPEPVS